MMEIATWFLGKFGELFIEKSAKRLGSKIANMRARQELADACSIAIEAAADAAPALGEDLRSESFRLLVLEMVRHLLESPATPATSETFASYYVDMFVTRFSTADGIDATLQRVFQTDRAAVTGAFAAFHRALREELYKSEHWREDQLYRDVARIPEIVDRSTTWPGQPEFGTLATQVDVNRALRDAEVASTDLRSWPTDIRGIRLETPAFNRLVNRVLENPSGRTLLVGEAGMGKSALLARLAGELEAKGVNVFAIKADLLPASLSSLGDLARALGVREGIEESIAALASERPVALLLDQLDAVSDVMDRQSSRMRLLLQLVHRLGVRPSVGDMALRVHVIVSSRPFEASHDARFQQLKAEMICLDMLSDDQVNALLTHLGLTPDTVDLGMRQTLRRPFALKLFAEIVLRGADCRDLTPAGLLDSWLATADIGDSAGRKAVTRFLTALAEEMIETETLWRPADAFDLAHAEAVRRAVAVGLIVRSGKLLGFSHQSWLDDFQAKSFRTGTDLAGYALERQDSLFMRATVLRGFERLRAQDPRGYEVALKALLGNPHTRRHIRHLLVDIVATVSDPQPFEIAWVEHWIRHDRPLAARALRQVAKRWNAWRDGLHRVLPTIMTREDFHPQAAHLLAAEVPYDSNSVGNLLDRHWNNPNTDHLVCEIILRSGCIGLDAPARLRTIFARTSIDADAVSDFVHRLHTEGRFEEAADVVATWLEFQDVKIALPSEIYGIKELAETAPLALARKLLPWFVHLARREVEPHHHVTRRFPRSNAVPYDWEIERERDSPFQALNHAVEELGKRDPQALWDTLAPFASVAVDQVQALLAIGMAAAGPALADKALDFLLSDSRRFQISHATAYVGRGTISELQGWPSHLLVHAIVPALGDAQLLALRDAIECWSSYTDAAMEDEDAEIVARRTRSADVARFPLLEALPARVLDPSRYAQIVEWRKGHPKVDVLHDNPEFCGFVGPSMTHEEMAEAADSEILASLDEFHDDSGNKSRLTIPIRRSGGVRELARAFGAFCKADPARGITISDALVPGRHELAAGALVRELAAAGSAIPSEVLTLVIRLDARGFASTEWRQAAAHALQDIARRQNGLDDAVVALIESWLETDSERVKAQIAKRREFEARHPRADRSRRGPRPILFRSSGGSDALPQDNFTLLSAIANGLLCREPSGCESWACILEQHIERPEDPAIWVSLLRWHGEGLIGADPIRVSWILDHLWDRFPEIWRDMRMTQFLWYLRSRIPDRILIGALTAWMASDDPACKQAAGELLAAYHIVDPDVTLYQLLFERLDRSVEEVETGILFSAAAAWGECEPKLRASAHHLLMASLATARGSAAYALSRAIDTRPSLIPDAMTHEMLTAVVEYPEVLSAALNHGFANALQSLLLSPGFDAVVLAVIERIAQIVTIPGAGRRRLVDQELVHVAIALQRSDSPLRARAMDVYEQFLDAALYGAEEAAMASLNR